jgi:hypothetical protein
MDSDCFPLNGGWLDELSQELGKSDCVLAGDWHTGLTHPCFMAMPIDAIRHVDFTDGIEVRIATGRLVGLQLQRAGYSVKILRPKKAFNGLRGALYLKDSLLHVGSASFASSTDPRVFRQVNPLLDDIVRRRISVNSHHLRFIHRTRLRLRRTRKQVTRRLFRRLALFWAPTHN